jgi:hypothetical protein
LLVAIVGTWHRIDEVNDQKVKKQRVFQYTCNEVAEGEEAKGCAILVGSNPDGDLESTVCAVHPLHSEVCHLEKPALLGIQNRWTQDRPSPTGLRTIAI